MKIMFTGCGETGPLWSASLKRWGAKYGGIVPGNVSAHGGDIFDWPDEVANHYMETMPTDFVPVSDIGEPIPMNVHLPAAKPSEIVKPQHRHHRAIETHKRSHHKSVTDYPDK